LDENIAICFAYYNYRTLELQDPSQIAAALIKQLCRKRDDIPPWLLKFKHDSLSSSTASKQESFIKLAEDLEFKEVFVVIDALDECPERERYHIICFITEVMKSLRCAKIFVTSRRESDIVRAFEDSNTPTIQIKAENVAADIENFVQSEVKKLRKGFYGKKLHLTSDVLEARIIQTLTEKAEGMLVIALKNKLVQPANREVGSFG
jgi:ankyrin repeat domain-containing protein 50